jgi:hypothetical protein
MSKFYTFYDMYADTTVTIYGINFEYYILRHPLFLRGRVSARLMHADI